MIEKAITQVIIAAGIISDDKLKTIYEKLQFELHNEINIELSEIFTRINMEVKDLGFEIRTVVIKQNDQRTRYHSFTNIQDDIVSKTYGSELLGKEVIFLKKMLIRLQAQGRLSTADITHGHFEVSDLPDGDKNRWKNDQFVAVLNKLLNESW